MINCDKICWDLVEEAARENRCRLSYEEKCSAAGLGLAFGLAVYESGQGNQYSFLKECMEKAIKLSLKNDNKYKRVESTYALDKEIICEDGAVNGHNFFPTKEISVEKAVLFHEFENSLLKKEGEVWKLLVAGFGLQEVVEELDTSAQFVEQIKNQIWCKYKEQCINCI